MYHRPMNAPLADLAVFILAGGKSTRMGTDKAFVLLDGRTLIERALEAGRAVSSDVRIVCPGEQGQAARVQPFAPVVQDRFPGCGPLAGIHAALCTSTREWNLMLAVDLPFVTPALFEFLAAIARGSGAIVTVPRVAGRLQPLCGVYRREFADTAENSLRAGRYKIDACFDPDQTLVVGEDELQEGGFPAEMFCNLNTPEELATHSGRLITDL
ncbi:MAG TPA: molybdenum cofactor guanylyltransferase [Verrucomicrobiae bacterium]|nr:molybdenum cofactor guanylyltransferase [Verrucomicrobiae bacterium]